MKITLSCVIFAVLLTSGFCTTTDPVDTTSTHPSDTTTESTATSSTTSTTIPPTTTTSTTTLPTTTTSSTTSPPITTTSTEAPTTKPTPETTTPVVTTVPPSTTTKSPDPPTPEVTSWTVKDGNTTCIRADLRVRFKIPIKGHDEYIALSQNATSGGTCKGVNETQELTLTESEYVLTLNFDKDSTSAFLSGVQLSYTLPDGSGEVSNDTHLYNVKLGNSYLCSSTDDIQLGNVTLEVFYVHIQAFGTDENGFGKAEECEADNKVSDIVPIAVGCALLALVVVVLIAYFVGRRKSRQKGYLSV